MLSASGLTGYTGPTPVCQCRGTPKQRLPECRLSASAEPRGWPMTEQPRAGPITAPQPDSARAPERKPKARACAQLFPSETVTRKTSSRTARRALSHANWPRRSWVRAGRTRTPCCQPLAGSPGAAVGGSPGVSVGGSPGVAGGSPGAAGGPPGAAAGCFFLKSSWPEHRLFLD